MVEGGEMGHLGGGSLEYLGQWLGAQWARPLPGSAELPGAARCALRRRRSRAGGGCQGGHFDPAAARREHVQPQPVLEAARVRVLLGLGLGLGLGVGVRGWGQVLGLEF